MSRQCRAHDRVGVLMLGVHGKQMHKTESSATHDSVRTLGDSALGTCTTRHYTREERTWAHAIGLRTQSRHSIATKISLS